MAKKTVKSRAGSAPTVRIIDLKPEETGVLSLVATYAGDPEAKCVLENVLGTATNRAQQIGSAILDPSKNVKPAYKLMAQRFLDASEHNAKNAQILKANAPPGLWVERGL